MTRGSGARGPGHGVREHRDAGPPQTEASQPCPEPKTRRKTTGKARHLPTSKAKVNRANVVRLLPVVLVPLPRPRARGACCGSWRNEGECSCAPLSAVILNFDP